jgi:hypothetical protein
MFRNQLLTEAICCTMDRIVGTRERAVPARAGAATCGGVMLHGPYSGYGARLSGYDSRTPLLGRAGPAGVPGNENVPWGSGSQPGRAWRGAGGRWELGCWRDSACPSSSRTVPSRPPAGPPAAVASRSTLLCPSRRRTAHARAPGTCARVADSCSGGCRNTRWMAI